MGPIIEKKKISLKKVLKKIFNKRQFKRFLGLSAAGLLGVAVTFGVLKLAEEPPYNPLGPYPEQQVIARDSVTIPSTAETDVPLPLVSLEDEHIIVTGSKCSDEETQVIGQYGWRSAEPSGFDFTFFEGVSAVRIKGCQSFMFQNDFPEEVKRWVERSLQRDVERDHVEMYLSGCETPIKDDGTKGVEICWRTQTFAIQL